MLAARHFVKWFKSPTGHELIGIKLERKFFLCIRDICVVIDWKFLKDK